MGKRHYLLVTLFVASSFFISGCERPKANNPMQQNPAAPVPISVDEVRMDNLPAVLEATGQTQASNTVNIYSRVNGYLKKRAYKEGSKVEEGDTLFVIDPSDYENALLSAKASLMQAEASYENAKAVLNRVKPLAEKNAVSKQELDNAMANERSAAAALEGAKAALSQAKLNLSYTNIKSPINGYADRAKIDNGTFVAAGANGLLTTVYQTDPMYVNFSFSESEKLVVQNAIATGKLELPKDGKYDIELTLSDGTVLNLKGEISFMAPFFDSVTGTMSYRATIKNSDQKLSVGQFVRVKLKGLAWKSALYLPQKTVLTGDKGKFVYLIEKNNTVSPRGVTIGGWVGDKVIIQSGLQKGDKIAVTGLTKLRPGANVTITANR